MWTNARFAGARRGGSLVQMEPSRALYRFAGALEPLLVAPDAAAFERAWDAAHLDRLAWEALALARRANSAALEPALHAVDRRLLAVLERCRSFLDPHLVTFRVPELERCQHAAAAPLPRSQDSRVAVRPRGGAHPPAVRGAARHGPHRPRRGALRGDPGPRGRAPAHGTRGAELEVRRR